MIHPLNPLTTAEVQQASAIMRHAGLITDAVAFVDVELDEPTKEALAANAPIARVARATLYDREEGVVIEARVDVDQRTVLSFEKKPGVRPRITLADFERGEALVKASPVFEEAMTRRGVTDLSLVMVEPESAGYYGPGDDQGRRLRTLCWVRSSETDNGYAHPIDGICFVVDLDTGAVEKEEELPEVPIPQQAANYRREYFETMQDVKPLEIVQPEGPGFTVEDHHIRWQNWDFRLGFTPKEGLVLFDLTWHENGKARPVMHRGALCEMLVPYGDPSLTQHRKNVFDVGEYGVGELANSLQLGCDCLGEIRYVDAVLSDEEGAPRVIKNAICLHEEDFGILWKHTDWRTGNVEVRRSRRFVASSIATVGNYEYGFFWYLYLDGTVQFEVKLTGIISTAALREGIHSPYGTTLGDGLYGPIHQHFFCVRLDMDIDGTANTVHEIHTVTEDPERNVHGNAFRTVSRKIAREQDAIGYCNPAIGKYWRIESASQRNAMGQPTAYRLMPGGNVEPFARPDSAIYKRAGFLGSHLWVTPYAPEERYAAGDYPNQHPGGAGLPTWTHANRDVAEKDVVLWYVFGEHHVVRPEDWPVMPCAYIGFTLKPDGFFDRNPALNLRPSDHDHGCCHL